MKLKLLAMRDSASRFLQEWFTENKRTDWRRPVSTEQPASTRAILERDPAKDAEHLNRPLPEERQWKAKPDAKTTDEAVGARTITDEEKAVYRGLQHASYRNSFAPLDIDSHASRQETRERAADAFMAAAGTGRKYWELTDDEKRAIHHYYDLFGNAQERAAVTRSQLMSDDLVAEYFDARVGGKKS